MIPYKQLSLADIFTDCQNKFDNDKYQFLELLENTLNLDEIVPVSFVSHFHAATGRPRKHLLYPMLKALLLQLIFSIPTTSLLIVFLKYSQELRDFCGFDVVPDASKFTRFKQDFLSDLQSIFSHLVDLTEPICQQIHKDKAAMLLFDTSGIEAWVTENNPKYANHIIKQLKSFKKAHNLDDSYDPYKAAYGSMPSHAAANPAVRQMYINGNSVMPINLALSQTDWELSGIFPFTTKTSSIRILRLPSKRNPTPPMRIKALQTRKRSSLYEKISFKNIRLSIRKFFSGMPLLIPPKFINTCFSKLPLRKHIFRLTEGFPSQKPTAL